MNLGRGELYMFALYNNTPLCGLKLLEKYFTYSVGFGICITLFFLGFFMGCSRSANIENTAAENFVLKSGIMEISIHEFAEELEVRRAAYPYDITDHPQEYNELVIRLVDQLSDELILSRHAGEKGVAVTASCIQKEEDRIREDYPDKSFEAMLLEMAVPYHFWKRRLARQLLLDKVIQQDLEEKITFTPDEMADFYQAHEERYKTDQGASSKSKISTEFELVTDLKREKLEMEYPKWLKKLKGIYPVEISHSNLKLFLKNM